MLQLLHTCVLQRNQAVGTNGRHQVATFATGVSCLALPMNAATTIQNGFSLGRGYDIYFATGQDVKPGDKAVIGTDSYVIRGAEIFDVPLVGHVHALAEQEIS